MNKLGIRGMRTLKVFHLVFIMMWTIGVVIMGLLYWRPSVNSLEFLYNLQTADFVDYTLVIPGALLAVVTGIIYGLKTSWGFFKYRWLTVKWIVGIVIIIIGTFGLHPMSLEMIAQLQPIANEATSLPADYFGTERIIVNYMAIIQAVCLIFLVAVSVFKPWNKKTNKTA